MAQEKSSPIFSTLEDDPSKSEAIDQFVIGLAEDVDQLQDADLDANLGRLGELATRLGQRAENLGYQPLAEIAAMLANACRDDKLEDAQAATVELTDISGRIRRGHRGSV
ncbi:MAG: hypothetical protein JRG89_21460 [Deltaproteobacteria bacterium]|nr:hypothetical protein [Deltaproteobacteria bacterium]MBW2726213.1 hypothetical protein [Deltaproteobacteria bacterium]